MPIIPSSMSSVKSPQGLSSLWVSSLAFSKYGKILSVKSGTLEGAVGKEQSYITAKWCRITKELKLVTS